MTTELQLKLFGNIDVRQNGEPVTGFRASKAQALLCYLAVTGQAHTRPALAGLLWADLPEASARMNLSKTLTNLRRLVGAHLDITRQSAAFDREKPYRLDVDTFAGLLTTRPGPQSIAQLQEAVALYQGDFLEGFYVRDAPAFEEWALSQRARYRELALQALHTLVEHFTRQAGSAAHTRGIDYVTRLLALEPWREEAHRQLMRLLAMSGQRGAALAQYKTCRRLLAEELAVEPGPEIQQLYEQIRAGTFPAAGQEPDAEPPARAGPPETIVSPPSLELPVQDAPQPPTPFVAREIEFSQLDRHLDLALSGQGRMTFIVGAAGRGKTMLAEMFARQIQQRHPDLLVAEGRCNAYEGIGDPYLPFREVLSLLTGDIETRLTAGAIDAEQASRLRQSAPRTIQTLASVCPDLIDIFIPADVLLARAKAVTGEERPWLAQLQARLSAQKAEQTLATLSQTALFMQYTRLLQTVARQRPLLLLLDDLQWADTGSISLLFHLGRRLAGQRILVLGLYRPNDLGLGRNGDRHPLEQVVNEFQRDYGAVHIDLSQAENRQFVDEIIDLEPNRLGDDFRDALFRQTGGHALFTVEMLRGLQERGDLIKDEQGRWVEGPTLNWNILPARVEGAIKERIDRLPVALLETLQIASVEGETFTAEIAAHIQGSDERTVVRQLRELDHLHRLVQSQGGRRLANTGQRLSYYRFRHILFQKYLYHSLDETERAYLHQAVGETLESLHGEQVEEILVRLARHFRQAGLTAKAIDYLQWAGQRALRGYANHEAIFFFSDALDLLQSLPPTAANERRELNLQLSLIPPLIATKGYAAAEVGLAAGRARTLCDPDQATPELFYALRGLWVYHFVRAELRQAHELSQQFLALAQQLPDSAFLLEAHYALGGTFSILGDFRQARRHFEQAIARYEPQQHRTQVLFFGPNLAVFCYSWLAHPLYQLGYPDQARQAGEQALALAESLDHPFSTALGLAYAAMHAQFCQNVAAVRALAERTIAVCSEHSFVYYLAWARILRGWAMAKQEPGNEALNQIRAGLDDLLATEAGLREPYYLALLAEACQLAGQIEPALALLDEALAKAIDREERWYVAEIHRLRGELLWQMEVDEAEIEACFRQAVEVARQQRGKMQELRATISLCRLWQKQGRNEAARQRLAETCAWFSEGLDTPDLQQARSLLAELG